MDTLESIDIAIARAERIRETHASKDDAITAFAGMTLATLRSLRLILDYRENTNTERFTYHVFMLYGSGSGWKHYASFRHLCDAEVFCRDRVLRDNVQLRLCEQRNDGSFALYVQTFSRSHPNGTGGFIGGL